MPKVNPHNASTLCVYHEVREVAVAYAQYVLTYGGTGQRLDEVGTEGQESFRSGRELLVGTPGEQREMGWLEL